LLLLTQRHDAIIHPGLPAWELQASLTDARVLAGAGFIYLTPQSTTSYDIDVTPEGFNYFDTARSLAGEPLPIVEARMWGYLDAAAFRFRHPSSYPVGLRQRHAYVPRPMMT
jgi:hypothetical protein